MSHPTGFKSMSLRLSKNNNSAFRDENGLTPLHYAAYPGRGSIGNQLGNIKELLNHNAHINAQNNQGETPLLWAIKSVNNFTFRSASCIPQLKEVIELLINNNCDVNMPDKCGVTPLHEAVCQDIAGFKISAEWAMRCFKQEKIIEPHITLKNTFFNFVRVA